MRVEVERRVGPVDVVESRLIVTFERSGRVFDTGWLPSQGSGGPDFIGLTVTWSGVWILDPFVDRRITKDEASEAADYLLAMRDGSQG